jgi:hypothetical protein
MPTDRIPGDGWVSKPIGCVGGLVLDTDSLLQGTQYPGTARILQNFEPDVSGGYRRISGCIKFDDDVVPGDTDEPITGCKVALGGAFATRLNSTDNAIHFSTGTGWTKVTTAARPGSVTRSRFTAYSLVAPVVVQCDGINPAWKWDGSTETVINGTGAPADPKYAVLFRARLALAGYGAGDKLSLSAPNTDDDFDGGNGALEFNLGDTITGLGIFRDNLVIFCKRSIKKLVGSSVTDFAIQPITDSIGCIAHDTIQELGGDLVYLSTDGIRSYAATERIGDVEISLVSRSIQPLVLGVLREGLDMDAYSSCCVRKKSQYRLHINNENVPSTDNLNILGRLQDSPVTPHGQYEWATIVGIQPYCSDSEYSGNLEVAIFGHATNGIMYQLESGNTWDGTIIEAIYRSPDLTFDDATVRKVFQKVNVFAQAEGDITSTMQLLLDREDLAVIQPQAITLDSLGSASVYGTAVYDTDTYGIFVYPYFKRNLIGSGFFGAFKFVCVADVPSFRIDSFQVQFSIKGRR